ncbi:MAG: hypothetical protein HZC42_11855 [Candidatus Eisenbacteria bacterium]|nr:hypothetical protein [Candidatus Eisenbacteria bacterium]
MSPGDPGFVPPFCPHPDCRFHTCAVGWRYRRHGHFARRCEPRVIPRFRCSHCRHTFSSQTFSPTYWLRRPELLEPLFFRSLACSGFRQIAREFAVAPTTVLGQVARLGRHCLLFQHQHRPRTPLAEPLVVDGFESFEFSQYHPIHLHLAVGARSHFFYAFTDSELRRKGRMTARQQRRRAALERRFGRPDPRAIERDVAELLRLVLPEPHYLRLFTDEHPAYPRALRRLHGWSFEHRRTRSTVPRTPRNPLFPVNLLDLLIRHNGAHHKRETIAFAKRRQSALERLAVLQVWRNFVKRFSERHGGPTPAMRLGLTSRPLTVTEVLRARRFPSRVVLPARLARYYWRDVPTRRIPNARRLRLKRAA